MGDAELRKVLGLCATAHVRAEHDVLRRQALTQLLRKPDLLGRLLEQAESEGLGPLAAKHLGGLPELPGDLRRALLGLAARHAQAHAARSHVLAEAIAELERDGIRHLFLKGAALAQLAYPKPALRPMRDVDLLLDEPDLERAEHALERAGFVERAAARPGRHEVVTRTRRVGALQFGVDLHRRLGIVTLPSYARARRQTLPELWPDAQPLTIGSARTFAPSRADLLRFTFRHGFGLQLDEDRLRFLSVADAVTAMESWTDTLAEHDLPRLAEIDPQVVFGLATLHHVVPLSQPVLSALGSAPRRPLLGASDQYWGWPRVKKPKPGDGPAWLLATLFPSEWFLRTRHARKATPAATLHSWAAHLRELSYIGARALQGKPRPER